MSRRRLPQPVREAVAVLAAYGRTADVDLDAAHIKIKWVSNDGRKRLLVVARSPSDHRANINNRCLLKRLLREEGRS